MLLVDLHKEFIFHVQTKGYSPRTIKGYKNNTNRFIAYLENEFQIVELEEVKTLHIKHFGLQLYNKGCKETYINGIYKVIRSFFNYFIEEGYILAKCNPCTGVSWYREKTPIITTFTADEIKKMINSYNMSSFINARNKLILIMLIETGVRNLELCQMMKVNIGETSIKIIGKGKKERHLPISPILNKHLIKYNRIREQYLKDDFYGNDNLFLSYTGKPLTVEAVERVVKIAGERANIKREIRISPHTFRHTYAQMMLKNGVDVYSLSRLLGHHDIVITKRYLQSIQDEDIIEKTIRNSPLMNL